MANAKKNAKCFIDTTDQNERRLIKKRAKILKFMLNTNALSLAEFCKVEGLEVEFNIDISETIIRYHEALFEIYANMQISARMWPEQDDVYCFV